MRRALIFVTSLICCQYALWETQTLPGLRQQHEWKVKEAPITISTSICAFQTFNIQQLSVHFALCIFWISEGKMQPLNAVSCQTWLIRYVFFQLEGLLIRFPDPPWVRDPDYFTSIIGPGKNFKRCISNVQHLTSRVPQLTCIWMSGASGLGSCGSDFKKSDKIGF